MKYSTPLETSGVETSPPFSGRSRNQSTLRLATFDVSICRNGLNRCSFSVRPNASQFSPCDVSLRAASSIEPESDPLQATSRAARKGRRFISSNRSSCRRPNKARSRSGRKTWVGTGDRSAWVYIRATMSDIERALAGRYRIERELGRGGMGAVYLARDLKLDRPVALKVLPPEFAANASLRERFLRETRTAASFSHPNIVPVHGVEEHDGVLAFVMGFVEGESIAERVKRQGAMDPRAVARMLTDVAYALAYAHGRGVVHRDIKPDNIMIERATCRALLMDFGISRPITDSVETAGLTRVGEVVGTPEFMSPEQATGDHVDG